MSDRRGGRFARLLGNDAHPRHRAADRPALAPVPPSPYELNRNAITQFWRAEPYDGVWCVVVKREGTPATGNPAIADKLCEQHARHMAEIHNEWLDRSVRNL